MNKQEIELLLDTLMREEKRRKELGGYSADAPTLHFIITSLIDLTLHVMMLDKQIKKRRPK